MIRLQRALLWVLAFSWLIPLGAAGWELQIGYGGVALALVVITVLWMVWLARSFGCFEEHE